MVENGKFDLWYSHWTANTLEKDLFWGPEWALAFIRRQEPTQEWLDDVWCEGAALVDLDKKTLLLFGGEDIKWDPPLRRVYLKLLQSVWSGWTIRWAFEGLVDIVEYVGLERSLVLAAQAGGLRHAAGSRMRLGRISRKRTLGRRSGRHLYHELHG